jgi:hypothetical protein
LRNGLGDARDHRRVTTLRKIGHALDYLPEQLATSPSW